MVHIKEPTAYQLTLSCGHKQLVSRPGKLGVNYPCWTACNPATPTRAQIVSVNSWEPEPGVAVVVASGLSNEEMLKLQRTADQMNSTL